MDTKTKYFKIYNINREEALKRLSVKTKKITEHGIRAEMTEMLGESIINKYNLFNVFFKNCSFEIVKDNSLQQKGADYIVNKNIYVDLKMNCGYNYNMTREDYIDNKRIPLMKGIPVEIKQYGKFTNTDKKITNYMLYLIVDEDGIFYDLIDYNEIKKISLNHENYAEHISKNKTGVYIKWPREMKLIC